MRKSREGTRRSRAERAQGCQYGDYAGVVFFGPPRDGMWLDRLAVDERFLTPLFLGIVQRNWQDWGGGTLPRLVAEWNAEEGWAARGAGRLPVAPDAAGELAAALLELRAEDVARHCAGCTVEDCLQNAVLIRAFIDDRLKRGVLLLFIEDDTW